MGTAIPNINTQLTFPKVLFTLYHDSDKTPLLVKNISIERSNVVGRLVTAIPPVLSNPNDPTSWQKLLLWYEATVYITGSGGERPVIFRVPVTYTKPPATAAPGTQGKYTVDITPNPVPTKPTIPPLRMISFDGVAASANNRIYYKNYILNGVNRGDNDLWMMLTPEINNVATFTDFNALNTINKVITPSTPQTPTSWAVDPPV